MNTPTIDGRLLIGAQWRDGSGAVFERRDPARNAMVWRGAAADAVDVDAAFAAARAAFATWADAPLDARIAHIRAYASALETRRETLAATIARETGKPLWDARGEVASMIGKIELSIRAQAERTGTHEADDARGQQRLRHRPHGVVAVFGPYNFPGHLPNGHIVPALLAGNTVLFKPSELTPASAQAMVQAWRAAGLPAGVLNLLHGGRDTGVTIAAHPELDGLFFTGSAASGAQLQQQLLGSGKILALEMGGNNPLVLRPVAALDAAVHDIVQSAFLGSGQRCTCARRLLVPDGDWSERLLARLLVVMQRLRIGAWDADPAPFMGPLISATAAARLLAAQQDLLDRGARPLLPMRALPQGPAFLSPGLIEVSGIRVPDEEHFGPLLQLIRYRDLDEAIAIANATRYGLAAGFIGEDADEYATFQRRVRAGIVNRNRPTTGAVGALPFGGIGASGNHRPSAWYAADYCAYPVASLESDAPALPATLAPGIDFGPA